MEAKIIMVTALLAFLETIVIVLILMFVSGHNRFVQEGSYIQLKLGVQLGKIAMLEIRGLLLLEILILP